MISNIIKPGIKGKAGVDVYNCILSILQSAIKT